MSLLSTLKPQLGAVKNTKRLGRGRSSNGGGTAGKGHKGQKARSGGKIIRGFEGGQMPLARRSPKFGFTNTLFKKNFDLVNLDQLNKLEGEVSPESLKKAGLVSGRLPVKILARGEVSKALSVKANKFSKKAQESIQAAGGTAEVI